MKRINSRNNNNYFILGCDIVKFGKVVQTIHRNLLCPPSKCT